MTIQKAIGILLNAAWIGDNKSCEETEEAVNIAIRSLKAWDKIHEDIDNYITRKSESLTPYSRGQHDAAISIIEHILDVLEQEVKPHESTDA